MNISLKGKSALIGGSSRGLGLAVANQLAHSGANVTLMSRNEKKLKELVEILEDKTGIKHNYLKVDFNDFDSYKKIIKSYVKKNPIDILINNTQGPISGDVNNLSIKDYQKAFDLLTTSDWIDAHTYCSEGLATKVCKDPLTEAIKCSDLIETKSQGSLIQTKAILKQFQKDKLFLARRLETEAMQKLYGSKDNHEAVKKFFGTK